MTKTKPKGDANRAMTLQALRAGPMTAMEMAERWSFGSFHAQKLCSAGLVEIVGDEYRLTPAGRAACPCRNPLAATAATPPEIFTMPRGREMISQSDVLSIITKAGASGITRAALFDKTDATHKAIANHLTRLTNARSIERLGRGCYVATNLKTAPETVSTAADALPGFDLPGGELRVVGGDPGLVAELAKEGTDIHGIPLTVDHHDVADLSAEHLEQQMAQIGNLLPHLDELEVKAVPGGVSEHMEKYSDRLPSFIPVVEDIRISDPETVEFCIYSSGGLDIFSDEAPPITLDKNVLAKLRGFLGLFQEAA